MELISIAAVATGSAALAVGMAYVVMRRTLTTVLVSVRKSRRN